MAQTDIRFTFELAYQRDTEETPEIKLDVLSFTFEESLNEAFLLDVELVSHDAAIDFNALIDKPVLFTIWKNDVAMRRIHGLVSNFEQGETGHQRTHYHAIVEPVLARTQLCSDWRIFQQTNVPEILAELFKTNQITNHQIHAEREHLAREYCVQPGCTDHDFIQRLAAEEGFVYTFEHTKSAHQLIMTDVIFSLGSMTTNLDGSTVEAKEEGQEAQKVDPVLYQPAPAGDAPQPALRSFVYSQRVRTAQQTQREYTFKHPLYSQEQSAYGSNMTGQSNRYERYDYPGRYKQDAAGKPFTQTRIQSLRNDAKVAICVGDDSRLESGKAFKLSGHPREDMNTWWRPVHIIHTGKQHTAAEEEAANAQTSISYEQTAELVLATDNWKADIPEKHIIHGPLIAHVTGPEGEEIYTDEFGRVKVQFPWDRQGKNHEHSSCWIRVAQNWAGAGWGHIAIPRIGQEIILSFLDGDIDQPIITGRTYDAIHPTPYKLPEHKTKMTIKSKTHKGSGFNELTFEDEKDQEEIYIHGQKDQRIYINNDENTFIGHDRTEHVGNNEEITIGQNRAETVEVDEKLRIGQDRKHHIQRDNILIIDREHSITTGGNHQENIVGDRKTEVRCNDEHLVYGRLSQKISNEHAIEAGSGMTRKTTVYKINASERIVFQSPGASIILDSQGIVLDGNIMIKGGMSQTGTPSQNSISLGKNNAQAEVCVSCLLNAAKEHYALLAV